MKSLIIVILLSLFVMGASVKRPAWQKGLSFEDYLESNKISTDILDDIDSETAQLISEIEDERYFYELKASNGILLQALIPVGDDLQIHLKKTYKGYVIDITPIEFRDDTYLSAFKIEVSAVDDIISKTKNRRLANEFIDVLKGSINFRNTKKGDELAIVYQQRMRLGFPIGSPNIKMAMIESNNQRFYMFKHTDGKYYDDIGEVETTYTSSGGGSAFFKPLNTLRITSVFTTSRYHPVLKRYRAHLGTDFGARSGTPIMASNAGKVVFSGWKGGYGNVIEIAHANGYKTLYAHQSKRKAVVGQSVNAGNIIGYVGSTGISSGAHLHFGVYRNGQAINPMSVLGSKAITTSIISKPIAPNKDEFLRRKAKYIKIIDKIFKEKKASSYVWNTVQDLSISPNKKTFYKKLGW